MSYRIEYKDEINDPKWQVLVSGLAGTADQTNYIDETLGENNRRFYRHLRGVNFSHRQSAKACCRIGPFRNFLNINELEL